MENQYLSVNLSYRDFLLLTVEKQSIFPRNKAQDQWGEVGTTGQ